MYDIHITDAGDEADRAQLTEYLTEDLGLSQSAAAEVVSGDRRHVTTVESASRADEVVAALEERGATASVEPQSRTHVVTGTVTFGGDRPSRPPTSTGTNRCWVGRNSRPTGGTRSSTRPSLTDESTSWCGR
jgi:hypothetical protein